MNKVGEAKNQTLYKLCINILRKPIPQKYRCFICVSYVVFKQTYARRYSIQFDILEKCVKFRVNLKTRFNPE